MEKLSDIFTKSGHNALQEIGLWSKNSPMPRTSSGTHTPETLKAIADELQQTSVAIRVVSETMLEHRIAELEIKGQAELERALIGIEGFRHQSTVALRQIMRRIGTFGGSQD